MKKRLTLLLAVFLFSLPFLTKAETQGEVKPQGQAVMAQADKKAPTNVDVKIDTPAGSIEVKKDPPPQSPEKVVVVVEKQTSSPPPSGGCGCNLLASSVPASGLLSLVPVFSSLFLLRWKRRCRSVENDQENI